MQKQKPQANENNRIMTAKYKEGIIGDIEKKLAHDSGVHYQFLDYGLLHMERKLPFLIVYRPDEDLSTDFVIENLLKNEAAYFICKVHKYPEYQTLLKKLVKILSDEFGAFLLLELWPDNTPSDNAANVASFCLYGPDELPDTVAPFRKNLQNMNLAGLKPEVTLDTSGIRSLPHLQPLLETGDLKRLECLLLGLEIRPFYRSRETGNVYPLLERRFYSEFSEVFKKTVFDFVKVQARNSISSFQSLARRELIPQVWEIDEQLVEIDKKIKFLMLVSPVNGAKAWKEFKKSHYKKMPVFHYRMLPDDPELLKRSLYNIRVEEIDDPTLGFLFREKRAETDKMLTMLMERESPDFLYGSLQLFGGTENKLLSEAKEILQFTPHGESDDKMNGEYINAQQFARLAKEEFKFLKTQWAGVQNQVEIKNTIDSMMVDKGVFYIPAKARILRKRAEALIQHEIGTHVLTYYNGKNQPLKLLSSGISGYEELQEGIAVLAEYLSGGLSRARMKVLAGRVMAVDSLINHQDFVKTFEMLTDEYDFSPEDAFFMTTRVYRGGGFTKDAIYLRGFLSVIQYLQKGNPLEPLLIGKIRQNYLPVVNELIFREILKPVSIKPRYLTDAESLRRLSMIEKIEKVTELINLGI
jgi:uncharacterized protein (TIGR02421 family)